jgi:hypothetical protein
VERGAGNVAPYADAAPHGLDVAGLLAWARGPLDVDRPFRLRGPAGS